MLSRFNTINKKYLDETKSLRLFFKQNFWGFKLSYLRFCMRRFECQPVKLLGQLHSSQKLTFAKMFQKLVPFKGFLKQHFIVSILFLDFLQTYQGWRHFMGYPVNGQRTWSNAWSCFRSNKILQEHKQKVAKLYYGRGYTGDLKTSLMAEHINSLWRGQWLREWRFSRDYLRRQFRKHPYTFKIDLVATATGLLGNLRKDNPKVGKKKKKLLTGAVGFDTGFTRIYVRFQAQRKRKKRRSRR